MVQVLRSTRDNQYIVFFVVIIIERGLCPVVVAHYSSCDSILDSKDIFYKNF